MSSKAPVKLALVDCTAPKHKSTVYTELHLDVYLQKARLFSKKREIFLSVFKPESDRRLPKIKEFDAFIIPDSSYTPTEEFVQKTEFGKLIAEFAFNLAESSKYSLCICFGMELVAAAYNIYPLSNLQEGTGRLFHFGYNRILLKEEAKFDPIFSKYRDKTYAIFAHRYFVPALPEGAAHLASTFFIEVAAFRKGNAYCVQWQPDFSVNELLKSAQEHLSNPHLPLKFFEPNLNRFSILYRYHPDHDVQNSQVLDLFFGHISD
ncbi:MAG: hypothetical protein N3G80_04410 [Candidatus Micrarchaeota archaeon]|nr:hypothetical protein [Candidatus Micrarchaeota archaeon]